MNSPRGYGNPSFCIFSGEAEEFELWSVKFKGFLRLQKLHTIIESTGAVDADNNALVYAHLVQRLDNRSLNLVIRDAHNKGREAFQILENHYLGTSKPRIISLYTELTSLKMLPTETITEYVIRAENASSRLQQAGEKFSDKLLQAMVLKGLPESFTAFSTIINNSDDMNFSDFKAKLRGYEENEAARSSHCSSSDNVHNIICHNCGVAGHKSPACQKPRKSNKPRQNHNKTEKFTKGRKKWCPKCKSTTHHDCSNQRRRFDKNFGVNEEDDPDEFSFKISLLDDSDQIFSANLKDNYLIDCGATSHIICDPTKFTRLDNSFDPKSHTIELADNSRQTGVVTARGDACISLNDSEGISHKVTLKSALCIPSYKQNILSVHSMTQNDTKVVFSEKKNKIITKNGKIFPIQKHGRLYYVNSVQDSKNFPRIPVIAKSLEDWHYTLGHCNNNDIIKLEKSSVGMKITSREKYECKFCIEGKMTQIMNHKPDIKASRPLELIHTDLSGPVNPASIQGSKYTIVFVDDYSGLTWVYFLKFKSDATQATAKFLADVAPYGDVKTIRSDNGGEYTSAKFEELLITNKIKHEFSAPLSPHQNGTAERSWRSLFNSARCMLFQSDLPKHLWTYAVRYSSFIRNRCFSQTHQMTPYEKFTGKKPNIGKINPFGTVSYAHVQNPSKLDKRATQGFYVGRDPNSPAHLIYHKKTNKISRDRSVKFSSYIPFGTSPSHSSPFIFEDYMTPEETTVTAQPPAETAQASSVTAASPTLPAEGAEHEGTLEVAKGAHHGGTLDAARYPPRNRKPPAYLADYELDSSNSENLCQVSSSSDYINENFHDYICRVADIPSTYNDAISSDDSDSWQVAMQDEFNSLVAMDTFDLVQRPPDRVIGGRWVYAMKSDKSNQKVFKARYVAKGFSQSAGINYDETFSPTCRLTSIRILCQLAAADGLAIHQMDVKSAYLNAPVDKEIYLEQPKGFIKYDKSGNKLVMKLKKSIYGLKQSGRLWNTLLHDFLISENFAQSSSDHCVYTKVRDGNKIILIVWVDDILVACATENDAKEVKASLAKRFKMKDFGTISDFLGMEFNLDSNNVKIHQSKYVTKILGRFGMENCNPRSLPCDLATAKMDFNTESPILEDPKVFREIVGSLIYLMTCTRPDICYVVSVLSQYMAKPTMAHLNLAKNVLKYLKGTKNEGLIYVACESLGIIGYTDADWATGSDRRSISGYCFKMNDKSSLISWKSKKQPIVSLSSCESEYIAMAYSIQESSFLQQITYDMKIFQNLEPVHLFVDNIGAIELGKNPVFHQRTKHIDTRYHYIRSKIGEGMVNLDYVESKKNMADVFTKPCTKLALKTFNLTSKIQ